MQECFPVLRVANIFKYYINRNIAHSMSKFCNIHLETKCINYGFLSAVRVYSDIKGPSTYVSDKAVFRYSVNNSSEMFNRFALTKGKVHQSKRTSQSVSVNICYYNSRLLRHSEIIHCCEQFYITY